MDRRSYGLSTAEAEMSRCQNGSNQLTIQSKETFWHKLVGNFDDPIIKILCIALLINVIFTFLGQVEWYESVGIAIAVVLATFVSTWSEYRNEATFKTLQEEASRITCRVYRDGDIVEIPVDAIVKGDDVILESGDKVPADGILIQGSIAVDQSVLNGESKECSKKELPIFTEADETSRDFLHPAKVFRGSVVVAGHGIFHVTDTGYRTMYGGIASELQEQADRDTPLKLKLRVLAGQISKFGYIGGVLIAVAYLFQRIVIQNSFNPVFIQNYCMNFLQVGADVVDAVMLAVIIIVMAVPEGLPLMIAIVSAQNMRKMLRDHVLVRKVSGIETAGSLNILFTDKTGTITKGQLETIKFIDGNGAMYSGFSTMPEAYQRSYAVQAVYNTGSVRGQKGEVIGGNTTERALLRFVPQDFPVDQVSVLDSIPFDSAKKFSAAKIGKEGAQPLYLVKGAPEIILAHATKQMNITGEELPFPEKQPLEDKLQELAEKSIRGLAFAYTATPIKDELPKDLVFIGAAGIRDELREDSKDAIAEVHRAGVQVVMITGDRKETAAAIAKEAGLLTQKTNLVLTSQELAALSDEEVLQKLPRLAVVARALPSDKSRLVRIAQQANLVVGMTGDGVNDSPALKKADVGFAMGSGTEVAKEASEIVILNNKFQSIARAILYGRTIFNSIRKFIVFQLTINVSAVAISFVCPLMGMDNPLTITQILWVNLVMDTLAALAFGGEPALDRYMEEPPKRRDEKIVNLYMAGLIGLGSFLTFAFSMKFLYYEGYLFRSEAAHMTGYFTFFILVAVFNAFCVRSDKVNPFKDLSKNPGFLQVMGLIVVVQVIMTQFGGDVLRCYGLTAREWWDVLLLSFVAIVPGMLIFKALQLRFQNKTKHSAD